MTTNKRTDRETSLTPAAKRDLAMLRAGTKAPADVRVGPWTQLFNAGFRVSPGEPFAEHWNSDEATT